MTDLSNEVREALDNLLISAGVRPFTRMAAKQYGTNEVCALIAAIEAAQLQRLGALSDAEIVEEAAKAAIAEGLRCNDCANEGDEDPTGCSFCLVAGRQSVRAALPILQAPLRAEIERLKEANAERARWVEAAESSVQQLTEAVRRWQEAFIAMSKHLNTALDSWADEDLAKWIAQHDVLFAALDNEEQALAALQL